MANTRGSCPYPGQYDPNPRGPSPRISVICVKQKDNAKEIPHAGRWSLFVGHFINGFYSKTRYTAGYFDTKSQRQYFDHLKRQKHKTIFCPKRSITSSHHA